MKLWYGSKFKLGQTMIDSWYCLDRVVPERMSQVWSWSEVGDHKRRSLTLGYLLALFQTLHARHGKMHLVGWYGRICFGTGIIWPIENLLDYKFEGFRSTLKTWTCYGPGTSLLVRQRSVCFFVLLLNQYWGIITVPGSFLKTGDLKWPDPHPSP